MVWRGICGSKGRKVGNSRRGIWRNCILPSINSENLHSDNFLPTREWFLKTSESIRYLATLNYNSVMNSPSSWKLSSNQQLNLNYVVSSDLVSRGNWRLILCNFWQPTRNCWGKMLPLKGGILSISPLGIQLKKSCIVIAWQPSVWIFFLLARERMLRLYHCLPFFLSEEPLSLPLALKKVYWNSLTQTWEVWWWPEGKGWE